MEDETGHKQTVVDEHASTIPPAGFGPSPFVCVPLSVARAVADTPSCFAESVERSFPEGEEKGVVRDQYTTECAFCRYICVFGELSFVYDTQKQ